VTQQRRISIASLILLAASIVGFWYVELSTIARIGALALFIFVALYAIVYHRSDVAASCGLFFTIFSVNQYLFDHILPVWLSVIAGVLGMAILWYLLFGSQGWIFAVTASLLAIELLLAFQFSNLDLRFQSFLTVAPFMAICQHYYAQRYGIFPRLDEDDNEAFS
jgi:hypothetical protein